MHESDPNSVRDSQISPQNQISIKYSDVIVLLYADTSKLVPADV